MVDKKSPYYVKSEYSRVVYGNDDYTTLKRELKVDGKNRDYVKSTAEMISSTVMP